MTEPVPAIAPPTSIEVCAVVSVTVCVKVSARDPRLIGPVSDSLLPVTPVDPHVLIAVSLAIAMLPETTAVAPDEANDPNNEALLTVHPTPPSVMLFVTVELFRIVSVPLPLTTTSPVPNA
jgi:hypothetical protein